MEKDMVDAIKQIISQMKSGYIFDAHFVIAQLIKHHSDIYIHFAGPNQDTKQMHGQISQLIRDLPNTKPLGDTFYSENIHGNPSLCAYWEIVE